MDHPVSIILFSNNGVCELNLQIIISCQGVLDSFVRKFFFYDNLHESVKNMQIKKSFSWERINKWNKYLSKNYSCYIVAHTMWLPVSQMYKRHCFWSMQRSKKRALEGHWSIDRPTSDVTQTSTRCIILVKLYHLS